jgi:glucose dehydrogenase
LGRRSRRPAVFAARYDHASQCRQSGQGAWQFRTGDLDNRPSETTARTKFQATPLFVENSVIFCSPFNEVIALDPGTGAQKWRFDPRINTAIAPRPLQLPQRCGAPCADFGLSPRS